MIHPSVRGVETLPSLRKESVQNPYAEIATKSTSRFGRENLAADTKHSRWAEALRCELPIHTRKPKMTLELGIRY